MNFIQNENNGWHWRNCKKHSHTQNKTYAHPNTVKWKVFGLLCSLITENVHDSSLNGQKMNTILLYRIDANTISLSSTLPISRQRKYIHNIYFIKLQMLKLMLTRNLGFVINANAQWHSNKDHLLLLRWIYTYIFCHRFLFQT